MFFVEILALRELEAPTSLGLTILLTFNHPRVTGQEAALLQNRTKAGFVIGQRLGDAVAYRASLA